MIKKKCILRYSLPTNDQIDCVHEALAQIVRITQSSTNLCKILMFVSKKMPNNAFIPKKISCTSGVLISLAGWGDEGPFRVGNAQSAKATAAEGLCQSSEMLQKHFE